MIPLRPTDKSQIIGDIGSIIRCKYKGEIHQYLINGFNLCYCLEDCISIIPDFLFYQIKSVNIRDVKKHTEIPKPIQDYLNNNIHILEEIKEIYLMNMLDN